jgi:hypothetical protein
MSCEEDLQRAARFQALVPEAPLIFPHEIMLNLTNDDPFPFPSRLNQNRLQIVKEWQSGRSPPKGLIVRWVPDRSRVLFAILSSRTEQWMFCMMHWASTVRLDLTQA